MFGECFDFAPAPPKGRRKQYMAPVGATFQKTPKEHANTLASQVGIDPNLLDGISPDLLLPLAAKDLRSAIHYAVAAVQRGKNVAELSATSLKDFLIAKIARLPLVLRFRLLEEWGGGIAFPGKKEPAETVSVEGKFISFGPSGSHDGVATQSQEQHGEQSQGGLEQQLRKDAADKAAEAEKARRTKVAKEKAAEKLYAERHAQDYDDAEEDMDWDDKVDAPAAYDPAQLAQLLQRQASHPQPANAEVASMYERDAVAFTIDDQQMKRDAARREQEAKKAASGMLLGLLQNKAVAEAGALAAKKSAKAQAKVLSKDVFLSAGRGAEAEKVAALGAVTLAPSTRAPQQEGHHALHNGKAQSGRAHAQGSGSQILDHKGSQEGETTWEQEGEFTDQPDHATQSSHRRRRRRPAQDPDQEPDAHRGRRHEARGSNQDHDERAYHDECRRALGERRRGYEQDDEYDTYYDEKQGRGRRDDSRSCSYDNSRGRSTRYPRHASGRGSERGAERPGPARGAERPEPAGKHEHPDEDPSTRRKKALKDLFKATRSVSPNRAAHRRKTDLQSPAERSRSRQREQARGKQGAAAQDDKRGSSRERSEKILAASKPAGEKGPAKPPVPDNAPPPGGRLRQLAFKNGWAEYVDQDTGAHVFKNVFTGEMTKTKPTELCSQISDAQNQRRLQWLANHRQMAVMSDMGLLPRM